MASDSNGLESDDDGEDNQEMEIEAVRNQLLPSVNDPKLW